MTPNAVWVLIAARDRPDDGRGEVAGAGTVPFQPRAGDFRRAAIRRRAGESASG